MNLSEQIEKLYGYQITLTKKKKVNAQPNMYRVFNFEECLAVIIKPDILQRIHNKAFVLGFELEKIRGVLSGDVYEMKISKWVYLKNFINLKKK